MELCERQLDSGKPPSINGRKPHLTVVVQAETLAGQSGASAAHLAGAGPISGETAKRLRCGGSVSVLTVDKSGVALDLGRSRRLASEPQRRVLVAQSRYCNFPGCTWEARLLAASSRRVGAGQQYQGRPHGAVVPGQTPSART